jgi:transcriptional regulator with XRE-family HTH domain
MDSIKAMISELMTPLEMAANIGKNMRLARAARGLRQEDLVKLSGASLQSIKNLEASGKVELATFLKVAQALGFSRAIWESCVPNPKTLDEIERIESARAETSRVRGRVR